MKILAYKQLRFICILGVAASFGLTGCKSPSSWKMPKMAWSREPSATTLAGTETPKLPESPANKYSPATIASVGAGTSPGSSSGNKAQTYGPGQTASTTTSASNGMAATANGYQNGPYTFGQKSTTNTQPTTSGAGAVASSLPSPYGGSYNGVGAAKTPDTTKTTFAGYPSPGASTSAQQGYGTTPPSTAIGAQAAGSAYTSALNSLPPLPQNGTPVASTPSNSYQALPPIPGATGSSTYALPNSTASAGYGAPTTGYPPTTTPPSQPQIAQTPTPPTGASPYVTEAPASNRYSGVYQPGTTGRNTTYNFGSAPTVNAATPPTTSLPPNTASGSGPGLYNDKTLR